MANLTVADRKKLWTLSGNVCSYNFGNEKCNQKLVTSANPGTNSIVGEECHIIGESPGSSRYLEEYPLRNSYENIILLCPTHHTIIDKEENEATYSPDILREMKTHHERKVTQDTSKAQLADSAINLEVNSAREATGVKIINQPTKIQNTQITVRANDVGKVVGLHIENSIPDEDGNITGLSCITTTCPSCGTSQSATMACGRIKQLTCDNCGTEIDIK